MTRAPDGPRILLVEDDAAHAAIVRRGFENDSGGHDLHVVGDLASARRFLEDVTPDLAIVDLHLPDGKGTELIEGENPPYPVVVMTSQGGEHVAVDVMKSGALDYVVKDSGSLGDMPHIADRALRTWQRIVETRKTEEALRLSEERYRALAEHAYDLIAELDEQGELLFASPNHGEILGLTAEQLRGTNAFDLIHPDDREMVADGVRSMTQEGAALKRPYRVKHGDGRWRWFETTGRAYRTARGEHRAVLTTRDVTERRELERQLLQSQKLEAVGQLAGGIAHDFNNLLTVISGYGEYLIDRLEPESAERDAAQQIYAAAERSAALTRQLLTFSRSEVLQPRRLDLNEVITDLGKMLWRLIGEDIQLHVNLDPGLGAVLADRAQIEQVVVNLAINARDAMEAGGSLTISTSHVGDWIRLSIEDDGHGMDEAVRERIFEPFFTTKPVGRGTGLGLSTVYGIVERNGGTIRVDSERDKGTRFDVDLPAARADVAEPVRHSEELDGRARGDETVLLVEDEPKVRTLLASILGNHGYRVVPVGDGESALETAANGGDPDLLLTDIVMPGMDGVELAARLRERAPGLAVVFMSGYAERPAGACELPEDATLLQKPFRLGDLALTVRRALDGRAAPH